MIGRGSCRKRSSSASSSSSFLIRPCHFSTDRTAPRMGAGSAARRCFRCFVLYRHDIAGPATALAEAERAGAVGMTNFAPPAPVVAPAVVDVVVVAPSEEMVVIVFVTLVVDVMVDDDVSAEEDEEEIAASLIVANAVSPPGVVVPFFECLIRSFVRSFAARPMRLNCDMYTSSVRSNNGRERLEVYELTPGPIVYYSNHHHHVYIVYWHTKHPGPIVYYSNHHHHVYIVYWYTKHPGPIVYSHTTRFRST